MEHETDEAILERVAKGDEAALGELHDRLAPALLALAKSILGDGPDAVTALHEGFVALWDRAGEFDPAKHRAFSWVVTHFRNRIIDRLRASHRRLRVQDRPDEGALDLENPPVQEPGAPAERVARVQAAQRAMRSLPEEQRRCIERAFLRGLTYLQLSDQLGATPGAVKINIRRGLLRLRDILGGGAS